MQTFWIIILDILPLYQIVGFATQLTCSRKSSYFIIINALFIFYFAISKQNARLSLFSFMKYGKLNHFKSLLEMLHIVVMKMKLANPSRMKALVTDYKPQSHVT